MCRVDKFENNRDDNGSNIIADGDDLFDNNISENEYWKNLLLSFLASCTGVGRSYRVRVKHGDGNDES